MERVIYKEFPKLKANEKAGSSACFLQKAIAKNLAKISLDVHNEWNESSTDLSSRLTKGMLSDDESRLLLSSHLNSVVQSLALIRKNAVQGPLKTKNAMRARGYLELKEANKSHLAMVHRLRGMQSFFLSNKGGANQHLNNLGLKKLVTQLELRFSKIEKGLLSQEGAAENLVSPENRKALEELEKQFASLEALITQDVMSAFGVQAGFNSADGD